ncbi:MAG: phosphoribosylamine--glycine ligase [Candidatus Kryptoniota bacterium]
MKILVVGGGGREHALVDAISREHDAKIFCAPGNAGISEQAKIVNIEAADVASLLNFVDDNRIDLTVVGPEQPLDAGIVDAFERRGNKIFGPSKFAARLETSKVFAKEFMKRWQIPTAESKAFSENDQDELLQYLAESKYPLVLKVDGLAAGKGVSIVSSLEEAKIEIDKFFVKRIFGKSGERIVVEEFMTGKEASVFAVTDGKDYIVLPAAQDHKRIGDGDAGKNTGGMGSFAPTPFVVENDLRKIRTATIEKVLEGTNAEGFPFAGCLYCGMMLTSEGPKVVEFNVRFGDPETQAVLQLVDSSVLDLLYSSAARQIGSYKLQLNKAAAVCVVASSNGYPDEYEVGKAITGLDKRVAGTKVFHSGSKTVDGKFVTSGGRVIGVTAVDQTGKVSAAADLAYKRLSQISFSGIYYRHDIAKSAVEFEEGESGRR